MTNNVTVILKKYSVPSIFLVCGIGMLIVGATTKQSSMWFLATLLTILAGVLSIAFSGGFLKTSAGKVIGVVAGAAALITGFFAWTSVTDTVEQQEKVKFTLEIAKQNMSDIRTAQKAYKEVHGVYAHSWQELEDFMLNGKIPEIIAEGAVPPRKLTVEESKFIYNDNRPIDNNMTELEAYKLSRYPEKFPELAGFKRDTVLVSFYHRQFENKAYLLRREKQGYGKLYVDSLKFIPFTNGKNQLQMTAVDSLQVGAEKLPALEVKGKLPFRFEGKDDIFFGSTTTVDLSGSWE